MVDDNESIWSDEPPTEAGWYWVDLAEITTRIAPEPTQRIAWLKPTGWSIPSVGFGLEGEYMRDIGIKFGPRVPDAETCRLISAAPALLEALSAFLRRYDNHIVNADLLFSDIATQARDAIVMATDAATCAKIMKEGKCN